MTYTGIDYHKKYSVACTLDARGRLLQEARIEGNTPEGFASYFERLGEPSEAVIEACWNWGVLYDLLEQTRGVSRVVLSHPAKNRIIAEAQIKTDHVDAAALATLLRGNFVAVVHVPSAEMRQRKNVVRQRLWLARARTMVRNRIHTVIDRHPRAERPAVKDVFCNKSGNQQRRSGHANCATKRIIPRTTHVATKRPSPRSAVTRQPKLSRTQSRQQNCLKPAKPRDSSGSVGRVFVLRSEVTQA